MTFLRSLLLLAGTVLFSASTLAQYPDSLTDARDRWERVPVIVSFELSAHPDGGFDGPLGDTADARIAWQLSVLERALGVPVSDLSSPTSQEMLLRRSFRNVPLVSMLLTGEQIDALSADPAIAGIALDRVEPPTSNNTIPLIGAATLHSNGVTGQGTTVAILDTGVDHEHPMFTGRIVESLCFSTNAPGQATSFCPGGANVDTTTPDAGDDCPYSGDSETPVAGCGHGTHVAGIAAGAAFTDPGSGDLLIGVAPEAGIIAANVFSRFTDFCGGFGLPSPCTLSYNSDQIGALDWLYTNRASFNLAAINMSLGGGNFSSYCNSDPRFSIINLHRSEGVATAIASGNSGYNSAVGAPGCIEPAVTVGATTDADVVANFSNSAFMVDLLAPGVNINSAEPTIDDTPPGRARSISGTSMATPHVAGAFALLKSAVPTASVDDIETALKNTGVPVTESPSGLVRPRIQVDAALLALDSTPPVLLEFSRFSPADEVTNADGLIFRAVFDGDVRNVDVSDFSVSGTSASVVEVIPLVGLREFEIVVTGGDLPGYNGLVGLDLQPGQDIADAAGNGLAGAEPPVDQSYILDNEAPALIAFERFDPVDQVTNADTLTFLARFSEAMDNVAASDFEVTGTTATITGVTAGAGNSQYQLQLSGGNLATMNGTVGLNVAANPTVADPAGNLLLASEPGTDQTYSLANSAMIGGQISGLVGEGLVLQNNGVDDLTPVNDGPFFFPTPVSVGESYFVSVATHPSNPIQECLVSNPGGTGNGLPVTNILVNCTNVAEDQIHVVDTVVDAPDAQLDGFCNDGTGACTLRAAIQEANNQPGMQEIHFDIPACPNGICVLNIATAGGNALPDIQSPTIIDGSTQPGNAAVCTSAIETRPAYRIVLQGDGADIGLRLEQGSDGSVLRGLNVRGFFNNLAIVRGNDNVVECNFIGTDETGLAAAANPANGVILLCDSSGNIVGGTTPAAGNLISGHASDGVQFFAGADCSPTAGNIPSNNAVVGNVIGVARDGITALGNDFSGISFFGEPGADGNYVGVLQDGVTVSGNVIGANASGIYIDGDSGGVDGSDDLVILGNIIGTDRSGTVDLGNEFGGVDVVQGSGNTIGGTAPGHGNVIAFNAEGVYLEQDAGEANRISANAIYANLGLGIELVDASGDLGVTPNDAGDVDSGANRLQNFPEITSAEEDVAEITVVYDIDFESAPLTVEFFIADGDEGRTYVGTQEFTGTGPQSFVVDAESFEIGDRLVATATDPAGNTSEFSPPFEIAFLDRIFRDDFE